MDDAALLHEIDPPANDSATLTDCSTSRMAVPSAFSRRTSPISSPTTTGARPRENSSTIRTFGRSISALERPSICCSPPDRVEASWLRRSDKLRKHLERRFGARFDRGPVPPKREAIHPEVLGHSHRAEHSLTAHDLRQPEGHPAGGAKPGHVLAPEQDLAGRGPEPAPTECGAASSCRPRWDRAGRRPHPPRHAGLHRRAPARSHRSS